MRFRFSAILFLALTFALVLVSSQSHAYFSTIDNGDLVAPGAYQMSLEPQLIFNKIEGVNFVGRLDTGLDQQSSVRALIGVGKVDFQLGALYKIIPFPDTARQPAMGVDIGGILARVDGETETSIRIHPLVSKHFETEAGDLLPYASLPLGVTWRSGAETYIPIQIVGGTELRTLSHPNISYFAELGINLNRTFSYLSAAIAYRFDDNVIHRYGR